MIHSQLNWLKVKVLVYIDYVFFSLVKLCILEERLVFICLLQIYYAVYQFVLIYHLGRRTYFHKIVQNCAVGIDRSLPLARSAAQSSCRRCRAACAAGRAICRNSLIACPVLPTGHGAELEGEHYLLPQEMVPIDKPERLKTRAIHQQEVLKKLEAKNLIENTKGRAIYCTTKWITNETLYYT